MINSPFALASPCIFLLVATGRVLTDSGQAKKGMGLTVWKGSGDRKGMHHLAHLPLGHPHTRPGHSVGSRRRGVNPAGGLGWGHCSDDFYFRSFAQG